MRNAKRKTNPKNHQALRLTQAGQLTELAQLVGVHGKAPGRHRCIRDDGKPPSVAHEQRLERCNVAVEQMCRRLRIDLRRFEQGQLGLLLCY